MKTEAKLQIAQATGNICKIRTRVAVFLEKEYSGLGFMEVTNKGERTLLLLMILN